MNQPSSDKSEQLKCYFSLQAETKEAIWLDTVGASMLTLFRKGDKARIQPDIDNYQIGQVVIFFRNNKMYAHRIVDYVSKTDQWITKGDTLFYFDQPVNQSELLGQIDCIRRGERSFPVGTDLEMTHLSATLGQKVSHQLHRMPNWLKFLYYFTLFIPGYLSLQIKRRGSHSNPQ